MNKMYALLAFKDHWGNQRITSGISTMGGQAQKLPWGDISFTSKDSFCLA